tara:strand:- start:101 stop:358 length:258 start_codon:yes stop_codon:yes gene_type:complete
MDSAKRKESQKRYRKSKAHWRLLQRGSIEVKPAASLLETMIVVLVTMMLSMILIQSAFVVYEAVIDLKSIESTSDYSGGVKRVTP